MSKKEIVVLCLLVLFFAIFFISYDEASAAGTNDSVTYSFNKKTGTLTISGNGDMPADMQFGGNTKIKRVVIEEGITSVCDYAFINCSKLRILMLPDGLISIGVKSFAGTNIKKLMIPSSVRKIGQCSFWGCKRLKWVYMPGDFEFFYEESEPDEWMFRIFSTYDFLGNAPKRITFITPLKIENISALSAKHYRVSEDDPLYSSIEGVIYSKDGTALVRIPSERTIFRVPEGVTKIYISAINYSWYMSDEGDQFCTRLKKLYLPKGECTIEKKSEGEKSPYTDERDLSVIAKETKLTGRDIELLAKYCYSPYTEENKENPSKWFLTGFKGLVTLKDNDCLVTYDGILLKYVGNGGEVLLDSSITGIGANAFTYHGLPPEYDENYNGITAINIPDSVTYIGDYAFMDTYTLDSITIPASVKEFGETVFLFSGLKNIVFEEGIEEIPAGICASCGNLEKVVLPKSLKKIGDSAFSDCLSLDIDEFSGFEALPNLTEIGDCAFYNCKMKKFVIPEQITKIGYGAFVLNGDFGRDPEEAEIIVMGNPEGYDGNFCYGKAIPTFMQGIDKVKIGIYVWMYSSEPDESGKMLIGCQWNKIGGIDGYEYEASVNEDFTDSEKTETTDTKGKVYVNVGSSKVTKLYARVRAYKIIDDKGTREYSEWNNVTADFF